MNFVVKTAMDILHSKFDLVLVIDTFNISINLLAFYVGCFSLIDHATHYVFCDR